MVKVQDKHQIQGYLPEDVFEAGIRTKNIPQELEHLTITPEGKQRKLHLGSTLAVVFSLQGSPLHHLHDDDIAIPAKVERFEPAELVVIEGESDEVKATLRIELAKAARRGTLVSHELEVKLLDVGRKTRMLFEIGGGRLLQKDITMFRDAHLEKVTTYLDELSESVPAEPVKAAA